MSLADVASDLQVLDDTSTVYLHRLTGDRVIVSDDEADLADEDDASMPEWQREDCARAREVLASDDWLALPSRLEIHPYAIMEAFCLSVPAADGGDALVRSCRGRGAFRRFRATVERLGLIEAWYAFERRAYERVASRWLADHDISFEGVRDEG